MIVWCTQYTWSRVSFNQDAPSEPFIVPECVFHFRSIACATAFFNSLFLWVWECSTVSGIISVSSLCLLAEITEVRSDITYNFFTQKSEIIAIRWAIMLYRPIHIAQQTQFFSLSKKEEKMAICELCKSKHNHFYYGH